MKKILFLGNNNEQKPLIDKIKLYKKEWIIKQTHNKIDLNTAKNSMRLFSEKVIPQIQ